LNSDTQASPKDLLDPDRPISIFAYAYTSAVAVLMLSIGPLVLGAYVELEGMTAAQAGYLFSAEMGAYAMSSLIVFALLPYVNWRHLVVVGILLVLTANVAASLSHGFSALVKLRVLSGLGAGLLMNMTMVAIGLCRDPDRGYGYWTSMQLLVGGLAVFVMPVFIRHLGLTAPFGLIVLLALLLVTLISKFPSTGAAKHNEGVGSHPWLLGASGLVGIFIYYAGQAAVWAYLERIGDVAEIGAETIGRILSLSLATALVGALCATWLGNRFGRRVPIVGSMICSGLAIVLLFDISSSLRFALAACLFNVGWYFCLPYITAVIAALDSNGRLIVSLAVLYPASVAAGPALAALMMGGGNLTPVLWMGLLSLPIGLAIMWRSAGRY